MGARSTINAAAGARATTLAAPAAASPPRAARLTTISVVVPAFNEEGAIKDVIERVRSLRAEFLAHDLAEPEIIVVDDGSRDRTAEVAGEVPGVRVLSHTHNRGYGAALKTGMAEARGDLIAFLDADGTYPPECLPQLSRAVVAGADLVIGSRMADAATEMPLVRRAGNRLFAALVTLLARQRVRDCASGMRVFRRTILPQLYPLPDGLHFTPIMSLRAIQEGLRLTEVPIPYAQRIGASKLRPLPDGLRYARSIVWTALGYNPARVLGIVGVAGIMLAVAVTAGLVAFRLRGVTTLPPAGVAAIFAALVAGVAGVSVFNLGITFQHLVALFRQQPLLRRSAPLERHFGWFGLLMVGTGLGIAISSLLLGANGWDIGRLWLYLVGSALFILVGVQLVISWLLTRTIEELSQRETQVQSDMLRSWRDG